MSGLFTKRIENWEDWGSVYCDIQAFTPLVRAIYKKEGMPLPEKIENLTPGTNAVFRCGDTVVKIYAPREAGFDSRRDFDVEKAMLAHVHSLGIQTSTLLASGEMEDAYLFRYLILRFASGRNAGDVLATYNESQRHTFALYIRALCRTLNKPCDGLLPYIDLKACALQNFRLDKLPQALRDDICARIPSIQWDSEVITHGDMTGENILMLTNGTPVLIDMADSVCGPAWYEWPPIVFELFHCDREMVRTFAGNEDMDTFVARLLDGLALHDFGPDIIRSFAQREGIALADIPDMAWLGNLLLARWQSGGGQA